MDDDIMRAKEAANYLKISRVTLDRWAKEGKIPVHRVGKIVFYSKNELNSVVFGTAKEGQSEEPVSKKQ